MHKIISRKEKIDGLSQRVDVGQGSTGVWTGCGRYGMAVRGCSALCGVSPQSWGRCAKGHERERGRGLQWSGMKMTPRLEEMDKGSNGAEKIEFSGLSGVQKLP
jgi:hypothetical protein